MKRDLKKKENLHCRVLGTRIIDVDGHRVTFVRIQWLANPYWPQCFTWIDNIEWPYRDQELKGHDTFPNIERIRKVIKKRER